MTTDARLLEYRRLPYERMTERVEDEDGTYYVCRYPDLPGLSADGGTPLEAAANAERAFDDYILARLHFGDPIPEPAGAARIRRLGAGLSRVGRGAILVDSRLLLAESVKLALHEAIDKNDYATTQSEGRATPTNDDSRDAATLIAV